MARYTVGVVGAGKMGRSIIQRFAEAGQDVLLADRHPESAAIAVKASVDGCDDLPGTVRTATLDEVADADIVVLALWYPGTVEYATEHAAAMDGTVVVDISNPLAQWSASAGWRGAGKQPAARAADRLHDRDESALRGRVGVRIQVPAGNGSDPHERRPTG